MDGLYRNNLDYNPILLRWINETIKNRAWLQYDDLHIDGIEPKLPKAQWVFFSLKILKQLYCLIDKGKYQVLLTIPISYSRSETDFAVIDWNYISSQIDITPPSFYLFPLDECSYNETIAESKFLDKLSKESGLKIYCKQELEGDEFSE